MRRLKLENCTKAELLWVIERAKQLSLSDISYYIERALNDLEYERDVERLERAKEQAEISHKAALEYVEIMKPYEGKKLIDIPLEVLKKADSAMKRSKEAHKKWSQLMK